MIWLHRVANHEIMARHSGTSAGVRSNINRRSPKMKMPYYDDEMTDRAVNAYARWCRGTCGAFNQPNRDETFRDGNTISIGRYNGKPMARYRVIKTRSGERVRRLAE